MLLIFPCSASRATECINTASRNVGPLRALPLRYMGASMCTKGRGTNSVNPPVRSCSARTRMMCLAQCWSFSTWPYMIVAVVLKPMLWAASMTCSHCSVLILSAQIISLTSSSKISAAVPGSVFRPTSLSCCKYSPTSRPKVAAPCQTSSGENAWTCMLGSAALTVRTMLM